MRGEYLLGDLLSCRAILRSLQAELLERTKLAAEERAKVESGTSESIRSRGCAKERYLIELEAFQGATFEVSDDIQGYIKIVDGFLRKRRRRIRLLDEDLQEHVQLGHLLKPFVQQWLDGRKSFQVFEMKIPYEGRNFTVHGLREARFVIEATHGYGELAMSMYPYDILSGQILPADTIVERLCKVVSEMRRALEALRPDETEFVRSEPLIEAEERPED